jgi:hypothetical protein
MDSDFKALVERELHRQPAPRKPSLTTVREQARQRTGRRVWVVCVVAAAIGVGLLAPLWLLTSIGRSSSSLKLPSPGLAVESLPSVAQVACNDQGTVVQTPQVRPQPDGLHFVVTNERGDPLAFVIRGFGGDSVEPGSNELVLSVPPGDTEVGCRSQDQLGDPSIFQPLTISDEDEVWTSTALDCSSAAGSIRGSPVLEENLVAATRNHFLGLRDDDVVEPAGYPLAAEPAIRVTRAGNVIATSTFSRDGKGGWLLEAVNFCTDSGLSG